MKGKSKGTILLLISSQLWKLLTAVLTREDYKHLWNEQLLPHERKDVQENITRSAVNAGFFGGTAPERLNNRCPEDALNCKNKYI